MSGDLLAAKVLPFRPAPCAYPALDYFVPPSFALGIQRGKRVRIHVKGRAMEGLVLDLFPLKESKFSNLKPLEEVFPSPALEGREMRDLKAVSQFFGGRLASTLDLALPRRVEYVEKEARQDQKWRSEDEELLFKLIKNASGLYSGVPILIRSLSNFENQNFVWDLAQRRTGILENLALLGLLSKKLGYSFLACVTSDRLFAEAKEAFLNCGLKPVFVGSKLGDAENYRSFLACCEGRVLAIGTRRAMYLPLKGPRLIVDINALGPASTDGTAPYANIKDVLSIRHTSGGGIRISMAYCHAAQQEKWLKEGSAFHIFPSSRPPIRPICLSRDKLLEMGDRFLHLPSFLVRELKKNGREGKKSLLVCPAGSEVLFLLCPKCAAFMKCDCGGRLKSGRKGIFCSRCAKKQEEWTCPKCKTKSASYRLIPLKQGPERVKDELEALLKEEELKNVEISSASALPRKPYSLVAILDAWLSFFSLHLDAESKVLNSWMEAATLASEKVFLIGECQKELLSSFEGWNCDFPAWDLEEKKKEGMPPFRKAVNIWGKEKEVQRAVKKILEALKVPQGEAEIMGPMQFPGSEIFLCVLLISPPFGRDLGKAVTSVSSSLSRLRVHFWIDPYCFGCR